MKYVADLHIHSKFSRATSRDMVLDTLACWAKIKGIQLLATGDFTHPEWLFLLKQKLEPSGNGFYRLKSIVPSENDYLKFLPSSTENISFILSTEISFIYSKNGKVRKNDGKNIYDEIDNIPPYSPNFLMPKSLNPYDLAMINTCRGPCRFDCSHCVGAKSRYCLSPRSEITFHSVSWVLKQIQILCSKQE